MEKPFLFCFKEDVKLPPASLESEREQAVSKAIKISLTLKQPWNVRPPGARIQECWSLLPGGTDKVKGSGPDGSPALSCDAPVSVGRTFGFPEPQSHPH